MTVANAKYYGAGRRKKSIARVYVVPGTGKITINKRDIDEYSWSGNIESNRSSAVSSNRDS